MRMHIAKYLKGINGCSELKVQINKVKSILEINNLLDEIENSKNNSLERLLFGLGIRHVGSKTAKILAKKYRNLDNLKNASYEKLNNIKHVCNSKAKRMVHYFSML